MGWSETYFRDYEEQTKVAWEIRARQLLDDIDLFILQIKEDAQLLGLQEDAYRDLATRLRQHIEKDFLA